MQKESRRLRADGKSIGLASTMGALHEGHLSLVRQAREDNDVVVVSLFVNPAQFGPGEDLEKYPRDLEGDLKKLETEKADIVFAPEAEDMYLANRATVVEVGGNLTSALCGMSRPGHFRGVTIVVAKLFNIVLPDRAYFGRKDYQQLQVIRRMAMDLNFPVDIVPMPTVREPDGLAISSRNKYLSKEERIDALALKEALDHFRERVEQGERGAMRLIAEMTELIEAVPSTEIDYAAVVDAETLEDIEVLKGRTLAALAVKVGSTRLIDNTVVEV
jgi:pantoate--beta-alanine ligase